MQQQQLQGGRLLPQAMYRRPVRGMRGGIDRQQLQSRHTCSLLQLLQPLPVCRHHQHLLPRGTSFARQQLEVQRRQLQLIRPGLALPFGLHQRLQLGGGHARRQAQPAPLQHRFRQCRTHTARQPIPLLPELLQVFGQLLRPGTTGRHGCQRPVQLMVLHCLPAGSGLHQTQAGIGPVQSDMGLCAPETARQRPGGEKRISHDLVF